MIMTWEPASCRSAGAATHHQAAALLGAGPCLGPGLAEFTFSPGVFQQRVRIDCASVPTVSFNPGR
jgi:hypothetical protein